MGTIPIPHEKTRGEKKEKPETSKIVLQKIRRKLSNKSMKHDEKTNNKTCEKLVKYLDKGNDFSLEEVNDLIALLQRSTMSAQKRKKKLLENGFKKLKKSSKKR